MKISLLFSSILIAGTAFGSSCVSGSLQSYINLGAGGCDLGAISLSQFALAPGQNGATPINSSQVLVIPGGSQFAPTLQFSLSTTATAPNLLESFFRLRASGPMLTGDMLTLNQSSASGDGADTALEYICPGASFGVNSPVGCPGSASLVTFINLSFSQSTDVKTFPATSFFDIFVDLSADGGLTGSANFGSATVQITATPEPASLLLGVTGLALLAVSRCRISKKWKLF
ncbi:MAG: hypothetical protein JO266_22455 [Acidobacteria bacterium]|nr:hypothetical protein [Acidobacteriota bacterium]MBV9484242.1 hypothetical protein [Acidobacteriota bacterium]